MNVRFTLYALYMYCKHKCNFFPVSCTEPVNLNPVLIPLPPMEAASQEGDIVHTKSCSKHVQNARVEHDDSLRLAKFYRARVEDLVWICGIAWNK